MKKKYLIIILPLVIVLLVINVLILLKTNNRSLEGTNWMSKKIVMYDDKGEQFNETNDTYIKLYFYKESVKVCYYRNSDDDCEIIPLRKNNGGYEIKSERLSGQISRTKDELIISLENDTNYVNKYYFMSI